MGTLILHRLDIAADLAGLSISSGGGKRDRTADLLHAMQALSQLSYTPTAKRKL